LKNGAKPYSPHVLARWQWVVWPFILLQLIGPTVTWTGSLINQQPTPFNAPRAVSVLPVVGSIGLCVWFAWCQPLVWAYDPASVKKISNGQIAPKRLAWWLNVAPRIMPVAPFAFAVAMAVLVVVDFGEKAWPAHVAWLIGMLIALALAVRISRGVCAVVLREFPRRVSMLGLCFGCGYNVSASAGPNCPECGRPMARVDALPAST